MLDQNKPNGTEQPEQEKSKTTSEVYGPCQNCGKTTLKKVDGVTQTCSHCGQQAA